MYHKIINIFYNFSPGNSETWTIIISIATAFAAIFTILMWIVNYSLFKQNRKLFIIANRPWIVISEILLINDKNTEQLTDIFIDFYNSGKYIAREVIPKISILIGNRELLIKDIIKESLVIFPNASIGKYSQLSEVDSTEILIKNLPLEISITINYKSIDDTQRYTKGNYKYDYTLKRFINLGETAI